MQITRKNITYDKISVADLSPYFDANDKLHMRVNQDYTCVYKDKLFVAKEGFKTDGASIPPAVQPIIGEPFEGDTLTAAVYHDVGCQYKIHSQKITHMMFREILKLSGIGFWKRQACFWAVRSYNRFKHWSWK